MNFEPKTRKQLFNSNPSLTAYEPYQTPTGYWDSPFCYVYDARTLIPGQSYKFLNVPIDNDADFILRRVIGTNEVCGLPSPTPSNAADYGFQLYGYRSDIAYFSKKVVADTCISMVPEALYPAGGQIQFDLGPVKSIEPFGDNRILIFLGVKRFYDPNSALQASCTSQYRTIRPYTYSFTFQNWNDDKPNKTFRIPITSYDFELHRFYTSGVFGQTYDRQTGVIFKTQHFQKLSNDFVPTFYIDDRANSIPYGFWPAPSLLYKRSTELEFEVTSYVPPGSGTAEITYNFQGVQRMPR